MSASRAVPEVPAAVLLAHHAMALRCADLPPAVLERLRHCIIDTVAVCTGGAGEPSSRMARAYAGRYRQGGRSRLLDASGNATGAPQAAFVNGVLAHGLEFDSLRRPGAGVHPGATVVTAALALAQEQGSSGADLLAAVAAGIEVMFRIGLATHHSCEERGYHAPGLTGPMGAAVAAAHLLRLDTERATRALGIAGSCAGGLLEFAHAGDGSMVKKLHFGRAAEAGILAARLAEEGFTAPASILDGAFGFLEVFCARSDPGLLTENLGGFESLAICLKRYPCHISAHAPVTAVLAIRVAHGIVARDVAEVVVEGTAKMAGLHNIHAPSDVGLAQYSIPFCVAVALSGDPGDPASFSEAALRDPDLMALCRRVRVTTREGAGPEVAVTVRCADGREISETVGEFPGTPGQPFDTGLLKAKFDLLMDRYSASERDAIFARLLALEGEADLAWIGEAPAGGAMTDA